MNKDSLSTVVPQQPVTLNYKKTVPWLIFVIFFGVLNETVFNVATPSIADQFGLQPSGVSLVITSCMIVFGVGSVVYGKLSDIYSLKKLITFGLLLYCAGSLFGFLVHTNYLLVIVARILQGAGGSAIAALIMVIIARYIPPADRGKAFGIIGSTVAFSEGIGPVIGGFIAGRFHWSYLFLLPLFTLLAIPFFYKVLPSDPPVNGKLDIPGAALLVTGLTLVVFYPTEPHWWLLVTGLAMLLGFALHIRRTEQPFISPLLFARRKFMGGIFAGFLLFCVGMGVLFLMPLLLNSVHKLNPTDIGWILCPGSLSVIILGTVGGSLADRRGNPFVLRCGIVSFIASLLAIALLINHSPLVISFALLFTYVGISFLKTAVSNSITQTLAEDEIGIGMGLYGLTSLLAEAAGTVLVGKALDTRLFDFALLPTVTEPSSFVYSNLLLLLAVILWCGQRVYRHTLDTE